MNRIAVGILVACGLAAAGIALWIVRPRNQNSDIPHVSAQSPPAARIAGGFRRLAWDDEFNAPAGEPPDPRKWQAVTGGGWGQGELQHYTSAASNASLDGAGHLAITARRQARGAGSAVTSYYTSARLQTNGRFQFRYGRVEARIKVAAGAGLWSAFWAMGSDVTRVPWPEPGEIDIMENLGRNPFSFIGAIHGPAQGAPHGYQHIANQSSRSSLAGAFHVYGVVWTPQEIVFTIDGRPYARETAAALPRGQGWEFDKPFFLILNLAVGGGWPGPPSRSTRFPATMLVDWVRVYA